MKRPARPKPVDPADDMRCHGCSHKLSYHNATGCHFIGCHCKEFTIE